MFLQFHSLAPMYYRGSAAAVIVYDITKQVRVPPLGPGALVVTSLSQGTPAELALLSLARSLG